MNRTLISLLLTCLALAASAQNRPLPDYVRDWRRADTLAAKGLPKSALAIANRIYNEAKAARNYPQLAKAAMHRMIFRSYSDEDAYVELVRSMQADIRDTPEPARSVLQSALAMIYWQYFQQNRYKFYNRATVDKPANQKTPADSTSDFTTWDAHQLVSATTQAYLASVQNKELLQRIPVSDYEVLIDKGDADTRVLRPTLYDLLAHRAISFFQNTEPDLLKPVFRFVLDKPDYLSGPDGFAQLTIESLDSLSGRYQALRLYQQLIQFHLADKDPSALADADAMRLSFVRGYSTVPNKDTLYRQTLTQQISRYKGQLAEAIYAFELARLLADDNGPQPLQDDDQLDTGTPAPDPAKWNRKQAADICRDLEKRYPKTYIAQQAARLLSQLLNPTFSAQVELVNSPDQPFRALVTYQNVSRLQYRIIRLNAAERQVYRSLYNTPEQRQLVVDNWLRRPIVAEGDVMLPDDGDLREHSTEIALRGLPLGCYALLVTSDTKFQAKGGTIDWASFWVSSLSYVLQTDSKNKNNTLFVTNRQSGEPLPNVVVAVVDPTTRPVAGGQRNKATNAEGRAVFSVSEVPMQTAFFYQITLGKDTLLSDQQYRYNYNTNENGERVTTYTNLFTDRAIYRPGQPIYVKGLLYEGQTNQYNVVAGQDVEIRFLDQNGEEIGKQTVKTNEFGTFSTSFTAPVGRLTGVMSIQTGRGSTVVRVEEYKRPTFEVTSKPIKQTFKLGQTITLSAQAKTFAGAVVDGAEVRYRVARTLRQRWDGWYTSWKRIPQRSVEAEIANGTAKTDAQGNVTVTFVALPDPEKKRETNPIFDFEITVDVTDRAGETRSTNQTLRIGYTALQAELRIPARIEKSQTTSPAPFVVKATNQSGEKIRATGQLTVYRLQSPNRLLRKRLWSRPDRQLMTRAEFERLFPNDVFDAEDNPRSWPRQTVVQQQPIITAVDSLIKPDLSRYTPGEYVAELNLTDSTGETVRERAYFSVLDEQQPTASALADVWFQVRKATAEPGETAVFWVGNAKPGWVLMQIEEKRLIVRQEWLKTDGRPRRVTLPVSEKQRGGFAVHFTMVQNGRLYQESQIITVPFTNKQLRIETQTFRSKLKPGQAEEWTLTIAGLENKPAELVATLYDASLDAFSRLDWPTTFYRPYLSTFYRPGHTMSFNTQRTNVLLHPFRPELPVPNRKYDELGWSGYRLTFAGGKLFRHNPVGPYGVSNQALRITINRSGKRLSGTVKNPDGTATPGVSVLIKGSTTGAVTDAKGTFTLTADSDKEPVTLLFTTIGYVTSEVTIKQKTVSLRIQPATQELDEVVVVGYGTQRRQRVTGAVAMAKVGGGAAPAPAMAADGAAEELNEAVASEPDKPRLDTPPVNLRRNFNETAFFVPQLKTDDKGRVVLKFTMPEALTRWRLLAFAHTKDLKTGTLERAIVTQKELMITANAPRFFREGDTIRFTARVNNLTDKPQTGVANLEVLDALTGEPIQAKLKLANAQLPISILAGQSQSVGWTLVVPTGLETVTCRLTAQAAGFTDGEEFTVPVLPNRMLVTDTKPFWVNGAGPRSTQTKEFRLTALTNLNPELPVQHERLTVEVTSNPTWYALQSLPYLMEYRYECAEQLFSRLYANTLAAHIVGSKPEFAQVISQWQKNPPRSPLESNEELKAITLENSPWLADARSESARQARLGQLLDQNRMRTEQRTAFDKLRQLQSSGGGFRWFGGMEPSLSMTLHILSGFGHLQKLGVSFPADMQAELAEMQANAIQYVDAEMKDWIEEQKKRKAVDSWSFLETQYLYARSFYTSKPVVKDVLTYVKQRVAAGWLKQSLQGQALSALALARFEDTKTANGILASLLERSRTSEELGTYWPDNQSGLHWYQTPIETQAYIIEAFEELNRDRAMVDAMKRWLIRQKQTQAWSSTKATTEAIYALLLRGSNWLDTKPNTTVSLGGQPIDSRVTKTEAITGYQKVTYAASEIKPEMGVIQITKKGEGPSWGALYWQHFEPLDRVMPGSTGLSVQKTLYVQRDSPSGPIISPVSSATRLKPGDLIKVRLVLKTDREMEYVHVKDSRASGFEPVAALSGYKYQNGLGYYESPRDASTDFFISYLTVGTHVFEYDLRVAQTGDFSAGVATVQCFYAPEFSAHSAGERVRVK
ncbi:alpha-2-macroglobulin family protein [Spirosoma fluminis]